MNKDILIAEFMGWKIDNSFPDKDRVWRSPGNNIELGTTMKFSQSWDWLIPVLKKIAEKDDIFRAGVASIMSKYNYDIEQVWETIVKHIELSSVSS